MDWKFVEGLHKGRIFPFIYLCCHFPQSNRKKQWVTYKTRILFHLKLSHFTIITLVILLQKFYRCRCSFAQSCLTFCDPMYRSNQACLAFTISWKLLKLMSIELVVPSNHLILCHPLLICLQFFPESRYFPMSWLFTSGGQSIGVSASVFPMNIQGWFPLELTGLISLQSKGLSSVFSKTTAWKHQFLRAQPSNWALSNLTGLSHIHKTSISPLLTMPKPLTVWITINCGKFWGRWEYQCTWLTSWETYVQVRKQQLELDKKQQTGFQ